MSEILMLDDVLAEMDASLRERTSVQGTRFDLSIPMLGRFSTKIALDSFKEGIRYFPGILQVAQFEGDPRIRRQAFEWVSYGLKVGALAGSYKSEDTVLFDVGCGVAAASISFLRTGGDSVYLIDPKRKAIQKSMGWAARYGVAGEIDETFVDIAENVLPENSPIADDVILVASPNAAESLYGYVKQISNDYPSTLIVTVTFEELMTRSWNRELVDQIGPLADKYISEYLPGRDVKILAAPCDGFQTVLVAKRKE